MIKKSFIFSLIFICIFSIYSGSAAPPPPPEPDITVVDAFAPTDDLKMPFGKAVLNSPADYPVLIQNDGSSPLTLGVINDPSAPFELSDDPCSSNLINPGNSCTVTVRFTPTTTGDFYSSFDILSDDPDESTVTVRMSGRGITDPADNEAPTTPKLVSPLNNSIDIAIPVTFEWEESTDPEGGTITYDLYVCEDSTFVICETPVNDPDPIVASLLIRGSLYAGGGVGLGFVVFGLVFITGEAKKRARIVLFGIILLYASLGLVACGGGGGGGGGGGKNPPAPKVSYTEPGVLVGGTTYYWKVVAEDDAGNRTDSAVWKFTTQ